MLARTIDNTSCYNLDNRDMLIEVIVKIELERIDTQKGVTVKALLDSSVIIKNKRSGLNIFLFFFLIFILFYIYFPLFYF